MINSAGRPVYKRAGETGVDFAPDDGDLKLPLLVDEVPDVDWRVELDLRLRAQIQFAGARR